MTAKGKRKGRAMRRKEIEGEEAEEEGGRTAVKCSPLPEWRKTGAVHGFTSAAELKPTERRLYTAHFFPSSHYTSARRESDAERQTHVILLSKSRRNVTSGVQSGRQVDKRGPEAACYCWRSV